MRAHRTARSPQSVGVSLAADSTRPAAAYQHLLVPMRGVSAVLPLPASTGSVPQPATVSLQFPLAQAGQPVWVHALDGGTINGLSVGQSLNLDGSAVLAFSFQAPAASARYQVSVRLGNVESVLRFAVFDPVKAAEEIVDSKQSPSPSPSPLPTPVPTPSPLPTLPPSPPPLTPPPASPTPSAAVRR